MKTQTKKHILAIALTMICFSTQAQMNHNTYFFGFSPMGSMSYSYSTYKVNDILHEDQIDENTIYGWHEYDTVFDGDFLSYKVVDGFSFSWYNHFDGDAKAFMDFRLNYMHGRNEQVESLLSNLSQAGYTTPKIGNNFRQVYLQANYGSIINNKHRVQFPLYIGMALGYAWTKGHGSVIFGMGIGAKMHVYITDKLGVFGGGHLMGAFGMYSVTTNAYWDFGLSYSINK